MTDHKPPLHSRIRMADGYEAEVIEYTERGFKIKGEPGRFSVPRLGFYSLGEEEIFTDTPEYRIGAWGFTVIKTDTTK